MSQQSSLIRKRESYRRDLRRQQLHKIFQQHRERTIDFNNKTEEQYFYHVYPTIDEDNYREHLSFILSYVGNDKVNFMLLPLVGYVYEELVNVGDSNECFLILEVLTQFQEIEIPQDSRFARVLVQNIEKRPKEVLNIISNLVDNHRYSEILRDELIEASFLEICPQFIISEKQRLSMQNEYVMNLHYSFVCILCCFIKSHPPVAPQLYGVLGRTLKGMVSNYDEMYVSFEALDTISSSFQPQVQRAEFLFQTFETLIIEQYINFEEFASHFLLYCTRSHIFIPKNVEQLLIGSLSSSNQSARSNSLTFFKYNIEQMQTFQRQIVYSQMKEINLFDNLFNLCNLNKSSVKLECFQCLYPLARELANDKKDFEYCHRLLEIIDNCIDGQDNEVKESALKTLMIIVKTILEEQLNSPIYNKICSLNIKNKLMVLPKRFEQYSQTILGLFSSLESE